MPYPIRPCCLAALCVLWLAGAPVAADSTLEFNAEAFAKARIAEGHDLLLGPTLAETPAVADADCRALYHERLRLMRADLDPDPPFFDEPRHVAAAVIGTVWQPALAYLPFRAVRAATQPRHDAARRARLDALRHAAAQQRCFLP